MITLALACVAGFVLQPAAPAPPQAAPTPDVKRAMDGVDEGYVKSTIEQLAGFGTRHSLSKADDPARGIGAARRWIRAELEKAGTGSTLTVAFEEFTPPVGGRVSTAT